MSPRRRKQGVAASCVLALLGWATATVAADWQPAKGPLMTRWAKDVKADKVHPEYPRPQMQRERWLNLNGLWQLAFAKQDEAVPIGKDLPERILVPFPVESALSGVMKHADRLWYRRLVTVPKEWAGQRVLLHFGAVDWETKVWVNGIEFVTHRGGYDAFAHDITDVLKKDGEQELIVGVWDPTDSSTQPRGKQVNKPGGIFYTPTTGIWQTVWLEPVPQTRINDLGVFPDIDAKRVKVGVRAASIGELRKYQIHAVVIDGGKIVARAQGDSGTFIELPLPNPKLWSPDKPFLYDLQVDIYTDEKPQGKHLDSVKSYFGMRKISVGPDDAGVTRILLNNKPIFQVGPLDQGFWPDGLYTAPTDEALKYDIEITKKLGFNMTRKHVKVEPARWYYSVS